MSPTVPISRFVDNEAMEPATCTRPAVRSVADAPDQRTSLSQQLDAQLRAQLEGDPLPILPAADELNLVAEIRSIDVRRPAHDDAPDRCTKAKTPAVAPAACTSALSQSWSNKLPRTDWAK